MKKGNNNNKKDSSSSKKSAAASKDASPPLLVILMGFPGSGKSTFRKSVLKKTGDAVVGVCQDELGSSEAVKGELQRALKKGNNVLCDRCNVHPKDRKMWATEARRVSPECRIALVWLDTSVDTCIQRAKERKQHETLDAERAEEVIGRFADGFKPPEDWELGGGMKYEKFWRVTEDNYDEAFSEVVAALKA